MKTKRGRAWRRAQQERQENKAIRRLRDESRSWNIEVPKPHLFFAYNLKNSEDLMAFLSLSNEDLSFKSRGHKQTKNIYVEDVGHINWYQLNPAKRFTLNNQEYYDGTKSGWPWFDCWRTYWPGFSKTITCVTKYNWDEIFESRRFRAKFIANNPKACNCFYCSGKYFKGRSRQERKAKLELDEYFEDEYFEMGLSNCRGKKIKYSPNYYRYNKQKKGLNKPL